MDPMIFQFIGDTVTNAVNAFIVPAAANLMFILQMIALTGATLYIVLTGYAIMSGAVEAPMWTFIKQCVKIIIISTLALTVDGYSNGVMNALTGLETGLADALRVDTTHNSTTTYQVLDASLGRGLNIVAICFENADEAGWSLGSAAGWAIAGIVVAIATVLVTLLGGAVVIVAKYSLAIVFALGPLFILSLMFPVTAKYFDSWFAQVLNYTLTIVMISVVMMFAMVSYDAFIGAADFSSGGSTNPIYAAFQILALTGILAWLIVHVSQVASGLAGGMSMAAMNLRHMAMPITQTASTTHNIVNPVRTRRDLESGMMTTARRANHLVAGNTMLNPAYRQHLKENIGKYWAKSSGGKINKK